MNASQLKQSRKLTFPLATRMFLGHLEGSGKALQTIKSYQLDLKNFEQFLKEGLSSKTVALDQLRLIDLEKYGTYLKGRGFKTNTRRRNLLTLRKFLRFLKQRKRLALDVAGLIPTPYKVERIPETVTMGELLQAIDRLDLVAAGEVQVLDLQERNRLLLRMLAETGCLVSEVSHIRFEDVRLAGEHPVVGVRTKGEPPTWRDLPISFDLYAAIQKVRRELDQKSASGKSNARWIFEGHNKYGSLGAPMTSRGVELLVKHYAAKLGFPELTPRMIRHSAVLHWAIQGMKKDEILKQLGLKSDYAFRIYGPLIKAHIGPSAVK